MVIVPNLIHFRTSIILGPLTSLRLVILGATASNERRLAKFLCQSALDIGEGVTSLVGGFDSRVTEPAECREPALPCDDCFEEVEKVVVFSGLGTLLDLM